MKSFSNGQLRAASEITGNICVAWFAAGIIAPLLSSGFILINFLISLIMLTMFFIASLLLVKRIKS